MSPHTPDTWQMQTRFSARSQNYERRLLASSCLSVRAWKNNAPTRMASIPFYSWVLFENLSRKFKFHQNLTRITITLHTDQCTGMSCALLFRIMNVSGNYWENKKKRHFTFGAFLSENHAVLWENVGQYGTAELATDDNVIRHMRFSCWIALQTYTQNM